jgi:hypothetical protein
MGKLPINLKVRLPRYESPLERLIPNDRQIYKVTIEKKRPPRQSHGLGHLQIRKYKET